MLVSYRCLPRTFFFLAALISLSALHASPADVVQVMTLAASKHGNDVFKEPQAVAVDLPSGIVYVADRGHHQIARIDLLGRVTILAGSGKSGRSDGSGLAAQFKEPQGIAIDTARHVIYVADTGNHLIRRVTFEGIVTTLAGSGRGEDRDGAGGEASFKEPVGVALDTAGNLYVADSGNDKIRKVSPAGVVTTFAGVGRPGYGDGAAAQALFKGPRGVAVSTVGIVFVADTKNHAIRKIAGGLVSTVAGTTHGGDVDGPPNVAEFKEPSGIAIDDAGDLWVADTKNHQIRRITADSVTTTVAGDGKPGLVDGSDLLHAAFHEPAAVACAGAILIADSKNDAIRVIYRRVTLADVAPRTADPRGGSEARLLGAGFVPGATVVTIGGSAAPTTYFSSTELRITVPSGPAGYAEVVATTPAGSATLGGVFQYLLPYVDLRLAPASLSLLTGSLQQLTATA
ncbi:MAG TPA: IPT/TIG domain-containing protein, partial [Thermoanaerobaculia bacterium]|nr:IPT/TIG domain-containing protein [Thermoanaerobaculia bacterium]